MSTKNLNKNLLKMKNFINKYSCNIVMAHLKSNIVSLIPKERHMKWSKKRNYWIIRKKPISWNKIGRFMFRNNKNIKLLMPSKINRKISKISLSLSKNNLKSLLLNRLVHHSKSKYKRSYQVINRIKKKKKVNKWIKIS